MKSIQCTQVFAANLDILSLDDNISHPSSLIRVMKMLMLFGTLPFYPCSDNEEDLALLKRIYTSKNVTVRNDPDGRSRLNVNIFSDVIVTDFGIHHQWGNIRTDALPGMLDRWLERPLAKTIGCHCPAVKCLGPNLIVKKLIMLTRTYNKSVEYG